MRRSRVLERFRSGDFARVCSLGHFLPFYIRHAAHCNYDGIWLDLEHQRRTGIQRLEVYAQGNVILENGPETRKGAQALFGLSTRGEIKLRSHNGKVLHEAYPGEPLYRKGRQVRSRHRYSRRTAGARGASSAAFRRGRSNRFRRCG